MLESLRCNTCIHSHVCHAVAECTNTLYPCNDYEKNRSKGAWIKKTGMRVPEDKSVKFCSTCMNRQPRDFITHKPIEPDFCPNCGSSMSANDRQVKGKLNSEIEKSKSEIVPDYRDGWRLREGEAE